MKTKIFIKNFQEKKMEDILRNKKTPTHRRNCSQIAKPKKQQEKERTRNVSQATRDKKVEEYEQLKKQKGLINILIQLNIDFNKNNKKPAEINIFTSVSSNKKLLLKYGAEHFNYTLKLDDFKSFPISLKEKPKIDPKTRIKLVDSMIGVYNKYDSSPKSIFTAVHILDKFLSLTSKDFSKDDELRLLGITCVFLGSKMEDPHPLALNHLVQLTEHRFKKEQFHDLEKEIANLLQFDFFYSDVDEFIKTILFDFVTSCSKLISDYKLKEMILLMEKFSHLVAKMLLLDYSFNPYNVLIKALASIILSFDIVRSSNTKKKFTDTQIAYVDDWIRSFISKTQLEIKSIEDFYHKIADFYQGTDFLQSKNLCYSFEKLCEA